MDSTPSVPASTPSTSSADPTASVNLSAPSAPADPTKSSCSTSSVDHTSSMLEYENQIFLDMYQENALLVMCEGLGLDRIFLNFLRLYSDLKELVFVLNTDQLQQEYYIEKLRSLGVNQLPCIMTSEYGAQERKRMYARGGIFFASSRILVMDLLVDRIPVHLVSGMLVTKAHKMADACQEPFILRLFRQKNKEGFIKGFTDNPVALVGGYSRMEKVMKNMFVGKVFLWPRFHLNIIECMDKRKPEVIEIGVELTNSMKIIQTSLLEIVSACLKELKSNNPGVNCFWVNCLPFPKWEILLEILDEIREANKQTEKTELGEGKVLICVSEMRGIYMIRDFLKFGTRAALLRIYNKAFKKSLLIPTDEGNTKDDLLKKKKKSSEIPTPPDSCEDIFPNSKDDRKTLEENEEIDAIRYRRMKVLDSPETHLHALHGNPDPYILSRALEEIQPRYVILYDSSIHFVRQLEVYKACRPGIPLRVYFLTFQSSAEEQVYLTSLRREKEAFHSLIQEKATMVIPKEREGKNKDDPQFERNVKPAYEINSRKAGGQGGLVEDKKQTIVVDMREFRSELPSLLHKRGIEIEPITIEVGDYILTPNICVERKSLSDLIGSLGSGRLYTQCVAMSRHYSQPMLLIEFDANKAFSFQARGVAGATLTLKELNQKLTLLLLHFPKLRLAWCSSPSTAAELFHDLKLTREQPDPEKAAAIGASEPDGSSDEKYNTAPYDFLLKLPGINSKNCRSILHHVTDLRHLCRLSEEQLEELLSSKINARQLYEFLHEKYDASTSKSTDTSAKMKSKRPFGGGKKPFNKFKKK
uniref:DNA repair endonuclease XPF n=1 Tax=Ciona intestinalis TaxID=7719 RepID=UPI000EF48528|nr:DNA repair endonuclease XPF [Ciona intestinalis]|eukprot:XP_026691309.1 DNA repair endonuclease XPF [Ciona intestinalis]